VDITTGESTQKRRERRRAERAVKIGDKACVRERLEGEQSGLGGGGGMEMGGTVKNHKSDAGALVPVRKGREEVGVSKRQTEVLVKTA
jgi:hypothetical protein